MSTKEHNGHDLSHDSPEPTPVGEHVVHLARPKRTFVLLSGGLDSTTALHKAIVDTYQPDAEADIIKRIRTNFEKYSEHGAYDPFDKVEAISINYGQRHKREMDFAHLTCDVQGIKHTILDLPGALEAPNTMLTNKDVQIPDISYSDIKGVSPTYVPFRNGTMLSIITAHAQKWVNSEIDRLEVEYGIPKEQGTALMVGSTSIYFGAHSEDAANWAYPDCTPEFIGSMANAIHVGSYYAIRLHTPLQWLMKDEIVTLGNKLGVDFRTTWSCYKGEELHCGTCPTCRSRKEAFQKAGVPDPTIYAA